MIDLRLRLAIESGRLVRWLSQALGTGGGTVMPGEVTSRLDPQAMRKLASLASQGVIVVTGTNGKTTTARMLSAICHRIGWQVVSNGAGANMASGVTTALLDLPRLAGHGNTIAIIEVDEAWTPSVSAQLRPRRLIVHNFFRDQLDRYGELDAVTDRVAQALQALPVGSRAILNADDPTVASLTRDCAQSPLFYGIEDHCLAGETGLYAADATDCRRCSTAFEYTKRYFSHLGIYVCPQCGEARPTPQVFADRVVPCQEGSFEVHIGSPSAELEVHLPLPGLYDVYNALAAAATALSLGIPSLVVAETLSEFRAVFGRGERILLGDHELHLFLVKNPVSFNQVIRLITQATSTQEAHLLILVNDNDADGHDISWLWDVDFELLSDRAVSIIASGTRALEVALRLKYAGIDQARVTITPKPVQALEAAMVQLPAGSSLYLLPTYTALLTLHNHLARSGHVPAFWQES